MKKWILTTSALLSLQLGTALAEDNTLSPAEVREGFSLIFDGKTLSSFGKFWGDYVKGDASAPILSSQWSIDATCGCIRLKSGQTNDVRSVKQFSDFELRFTYKTDGNQGVFYRALPTYDKLWQTGVEYAINDVTNLGKDNPGAAYDLYAPPTPVPYNTSSTGLWNELRIIVKGDSVEHWSNGQKVVGFKYHSKDFWARYNVSKWTDPNNGGGSLTNIVKGTQYVDSGYIKTGYLGLQGDHQGRWQIKNMKITEAPCFGELNKDGSTPCDVTGLRENAQDHPVNFAARQESGHLTIGFATEAVKAAQLIGLDGKVVSQGLVTEGGHQAIFAQLTRKGLYFLRLVTTSRSVTQKLNLL